MQKREFTSFDVAAIIEELRKLILNSRVSNIYQPDGKTLLFKLHKPETPTSTLWLLFEAGKRLHLTSYAVEKPTTPPAFCMALRKYLRNGILTNVEQYEFERVVIFSFKTGSGNLKLVLEIFGEGNVILIDEQGAILHALTYKRMRDRNILRGEKFVFAPPSGKNPLKIRSEEFCEELKGFGNVEVVRALARYLSIGGFYAEEVLLRADIDKTLLCSSLEDNAMGAIFKILHALLSQVLEGKLEPSIILDANGNFLDVAPMKLKRYEGFNAKSFKSFNEALDEFYLRIEAFEKVEETSAELEALRREAERLKRIIESQERVLTEAQTEAEHYKRIGDTIYANSNMLQQLLDRFLTDLKSGKSWKEITSKILAEKEAGIKPSVFFESFDSKKLAVNLCVDNLRFSLQIQSKLFDSATKFYEQSKKAKQRLEGAKKALEETRKKLADVTAKIKEVEAKTTITATPTESIEEEIAKRRIKGKEWYEKFRWFKTSEGFLVVAGKDAVSNEVLIKKYTEPEDIVFHADIIGASFAVMKTEGKTPNQQSLKEAAEFAAAHSRGWREGFATVDVYWVTPEQISKTAPSGEYVPHGAFTISGKRNWMRNTPLKIAIGTILDEKTGEIKFTSGPVDAVKAKTQNYVVIVPGDINAKELSKQILKRLTEKAPKEAREKIQKTTHEQIRELIPYGKGTIKTQP
jgi:predicted ribosome quality control (RQC) complex YloA/Tae2 family protein